MENFLTSNADKLLDMIPLIGLYAESHFRFWIPFSRYFKKEPELIFDTPWRLDPEQDLTIFLVVKDAHEYPVTLQTVEIDVFQNGEKLSSRKWSLGESVSDRQTDFEFSFPSQAFPQGELELLPRLTYEVAGKQRGMMVDNYTQTKKAPLRVSVSGEKLPGMEGWVSGDTHLHTSLTTDQIEFGASLGQTRKAAELVGLDFITATDHSYDLDDHIHDYLTNDPELFKWKRSRELIQRMNQDPNPTIIPGEEISVTNKRGATVHFLHFNDPIYFPGSGDSGENWPKLKSEKSIDEVLEERSPNTLSVGAHTGYRFPWLQRVLLKRGHWEQEDHDNPQLDGVQILSGSPSYSAYHDSRQLWIDALLRGRKLAVYGGSDGHGNFNRNWHIKLPVWSMGTSEDQVFAQCRTVVKATGTSVLELIQAMKAKRTGLTTGPVGEINVYSGDTMSEIGDIHRLGSENEVTVQLKAQSSVEFGAEMDITLYLGDLEMQEETIAAHHTSTSGTFEVSERLQVPQRGYLRLEVSSEGARWPGIYVSSPIWIEVD